MSHGNICSIQILFHSMTMLARVCKLSSYNSMFFEQKLIETNNRLNLVIFNVMYRRRLCSTFNIHLLHQLRKQLLICLLNVSTIQ